MKTNNDRVQISRIQAWAFRQPVEHPVSTSFGIMMDRPAVFVRIEDQHGCFGWGEIFANWPAAGAEHRVNLLIQDVAELVFSTPILRPSDLFYELSKKTHIRAIQCGEMGPFHQVIAGLDIAMWDLFARQKNLPVRQLLNSNSPSHVPCYASGIKISDAEQMINQARKQEYNAFKVKIGFDFDEDIKSVKSVSAQLNSNERLFADANQAWGLSQALAFVKEVDYTHLGWLEEPIAVDSPDLDWKKLASQTSIPIAGGENIAGVSSFSNSLEIKALSVYQPDIVKWGGFTGCLEVVQKIQAAGQRYCPHFLGGGIGLIASANLLAATGGDGLLEIDINKNGFQELAFATLNKFYVIDAKGKESRGFPLKFNDLITQSLAVFDYDNNRNYRFVITQKNKLLMYDSRGEAVNGFDFKGATSEIIQTPRHFRIKNKDYIVVPEKNGKLHILSRQGKERIAVKGVIDFSENAWFENKNNFVSLAENGKLLKIDSKGKISKEQAKGSNDLKIIANENVLVLLSDNKLNINNKEIELDYGLYSAPSIYRLNGKSYISIADTQAKKVYLFNAKGELLPNFPTYGIGLSGITSTNKGVTKTALISGEGNEVILYNF